MFSKKPYFHSYDQYFGGSDPYNDELLEEIYYNDQCERLYARNVIESKKLEIISWKEFYDRLQTLYVNYDKRHSSVLATTYLTNGQAIEVMLLAQINIFPKGGDIFAIIKNGHLCVLQLLHKRKLITEDGYQAMANFIASTRLEDIDFKNNTGKAKKIEILEWLESLKVLPDSDAATLAAQAYDLTMLEWLAKRDILPKGGNELALCGQHASPRILSWLEKHHILPDFNCANIAVKFGRYAVLKWLVERNIKPTSDGANTAVKEGYLDILEFLYVLDVKPTVAAPELAAKYNRLNVLIWLEEKGINPNTHAANAAAIHGHVEILEWLYAKNIKPFLEESLVKRYQSVTSWLEEKQIPFGQVGYNIQNNDLRSKY